MYSSFVINIFSLLCHIFDIVAACTFETDPNMFRKECKKRFDNSVNFL